MQRAAIDAKPARILVIDDDQALLRMLRLSMASEGLDVATARDGVEGLRELETSAYDVIVLDLQMPRLDGRAFFREMTSRGHNPPVVVLSAYGAEQARRELKAAAAVPKPFDPDDLIETVCRVVSRKQDSAPRSHPLSG
ncbi:MAG TPA: response regulator [Dehalococcoidia bacterium]|jgi:two-component system response regulator MprA|nr:response regulator [Dehalococcoidia bacterium]